MAKIEENHQNWWQFCRKSMWSQRYETTFIFQWIFAKIFTNFGECFGDLNFYWIFTNFGEHFGDLKKLVSFWVTKMSPILMTIIPSDFVFFCHQFWWKFWWFDKIGEFLSDKNITNSGDNNSFRFWVFFVTNFGENFSESL